MNAEEIVEKLNENEIGPAEMDEMCWSLGEIGEFDIEGLGEVKLIHEEGGGEGQGENVERVYYFIDHDIYLEIAGFYSSYDGTDWEVGYTQVVPKEKLITVYERI